MKREFTNDVSFIIKAILMGQFSDHISLEAVEYDDFLKEKNKVLETSYPSSLFLYSHSQVPGHRLRGARDQDVKKRYVKEYIEGIKPANKEMRQDIEHILQHRPDAIVVFAGDHGPFLTKTGSLQSGAGGFTAADIDRYDVQDRYGAFLAIRWPEPDYARKHDIRILQDIFPAVFAYLFDDVSLFDRLRMQRTTSTETTLEDSKTLGVHIKDGMVVGGQHDGEPLFLYER
jgi:hypothetical protein